MNMISARLAAQMQEHSATPDEISILAAVTPELVREWCDGETDIDGDSAVRLRPFLADGPAAALALERIRSKKLLPLKGEDHQTRDLDRAYAGGFSGDDAKGPK